MAERCECARGHSRARRLRERLSEERWRSIHSGGRHLPDAIGAMSEQDRKAKAERLAAALRENLKRRKAQARGRAAEGGGRKVGETVPAADKNDETPG